MKYQRVKFKLDATKTRTIWAKATRFTRSGYYVFSVVTLEGEWKNEIVICDRKDIISIQGAIMNNKYAELEVVKNGSKTRANIATVVS